MRRRAARLVAVAVTAVVGALAGCDREDGRARPGSGVAAQASAAPAAGPATGSGTIRGKVTFDGKKPDVKLIACHAGGKQVPDGFLALGEKNEMANVLVYLKDAPASSTVAPPVAAAIDQKDCVFLPRVTAIHVSQPLKVTSSDPVLHNFHTLPKNNPEVNLPVGTADVKTVSLTAAEFAPPIRVKCDVHPWMTAFVGVFDHPFYAVTGADGSFEIKGVPAGTHTVVFWAEKLGKREREVTVAADKPADVAMTIK